VGDRFMTRGIMQGMKLFGYLFLPSYVLGAALPGFGLPVPNAIPISSPAKSIAGINPNLLEGGANLQVRLTEQKQRSRSGQCSLEVQYPQLQGLKNVKIQRQINQELLRMSDEAIATFTKMSSRLSSNTNLM
jgi:hypothetical protein